MTGSYIIDIYLSNLMYLNTNAQRIHIKLLERETKHCKKWAI